MSGDCPGPRIYRSILRAGQAAETRRSILSASRRLFVERGYPGTTVGAIAQEAGVSVDTLYSSVGRKPELVRAVLESAISGPDWPVPAVERDYVQQIRLMQGAREKLSCYAQVIAKINARTAPLLAVLSDAATTDVDCAELLTEIADWRAANMELFAADVREAGNVRADLDYRRIADIVWATAGFEHYLQFVVGREWTPEENGAYLAEVWTMTFLVEGPILLVGTGRTALLPGGRHR
nr:TetR/AcrR family transcriptional regulator [Arthrobacter sp. H20]